MSGTAAEPTCHAAVPDPHSHSDHCGAIVVVARQIFAGKRSAKPSLLYLMPKMVVLDRKI